MKEGKCIKCGHIEWVDKDGICYDCWSRMPIYRRTFKD